MIKDHLGKEYATMKEMCRHYGVVVATFQNRRSKGWPLKDCLLGRKKSGVADHLGNQYSSLKALCDHYGIRYGKVRYRLRQGWTMAAALAAAVFYAAGISKQADVLYCF